MLTALVEFLEKHWRTAEAAVPPASEADLRRAVAALCVEVVRADFETRPEELERARQLLAQRFALSEPEAQALLARGAEESDRAVSLFRFTQLLNRNLDADAKLRLLEMLWRVAFGDGRLDKHEDALMHKLADLLYVPVTDLMLAKQRALAPGGDGKA